MKPVATLLTMLALLSAPVVAAQPDAAEPASTTTRATQPAAPTSQKESGVADDYFAKTPQLADPLRPLANLASARVRVRAMVGTIPDPVETHLGRSFDMALSATISAFQSQHYMLDGYAFPWKPLAPLKPGAKDDAESRDPRDYRTTPGILLFRRDAWRNPASGSSEPDYALVFLVGESPSYGVQRDAFDVAALCAIHFNAFEPVEIAALNIGMPCNTPPANKPAARLDVLGPSFSGSMQSVALAIQALRNAGKFSRVDALLLSASATVTSNRYIGNLAMAEPGSPPAPDKTTYVPLAWSLREQYAALRSYLCTLPATDHAREVIFLAEESAFGSEAEGLSRRYTGETFGCRGNSGDFDVDVRSFPPNIASIRAEHSILRDADELQVPGMPKARGRLLELDMSSAREGMDRPTVYEPSMTSRSDELMLFRMFDSLRMRVKPDVVVIVATDVRDRLFLLSQVRQGLPAALPVMMELDYLAIHPDYRRGSRGAVFVPAGDAIVCTDDTNRLIPCKRIEGKGWPRSWSFAT